MIVPVETPVAIGSTCGVDGFKGDLSLDREVDAPIVLDLSMLSDCHAMFALRLRVFVDWHLEAGHSIRVIPPRDPQVAQRLADLGVSTRLGGQVLKLPEPGVHHRDHVFPIVRFKDHVAVEDLARQAVDLLRLQTHPFDAWGDAMYMAIGELCDNAIQHGGNELGAYIVADRITEPRQAVRLAIADLGIGIPEHIRSHHPEWHNDTGAITRALVRGVSGTGDRDRGNGFAEVFEAALRTDLVRASSGADVDIRAGKGRVGVRIFGGSEIPEERPVDRPRRGTWITYTVITA
jgi:hypothetical protein